MYLIDYFVSKNGKQYKLFQDTKKDFYCTIDGGGYFPFLNPEHWNGFKGLYEI